MTHHIVLLGHKARRGKDELGLELCNNHGFVRFAFADKLKSAVADLYDFTDEQMYGSEKEVPVDLGGKVMTPRQVLQDFGQEQRERNPDIWAAYVMRQILNHIEFAPRCRENFLAVVTDFRFPNEYHYAQKFIQSERVKQHDIQLHAVRIDRDGLPDFEGSNNVSETALDDFKQWNTIIKNNYSSAQEYRESEATRLVSNFNMVLGDEVPLIIKTNGNAIRWSVPSFEGKTGTNDYDIGTTTLKIKE